MGWVEGPSVRIKLVHIWLYLCLDFMSRCWEVGIDGGRSRGRVEDMLCICLSVIFRGWVERRFVSTVVVVGWICDIWRGGGWRRVIDPRSWTGLALSTRWPQAARAGVVWVSGTRTTSLESSLAKRGMSHNVA
ncbi:hypothetical protein N658DRAFT_212748 [Parathielavia hyrcaniae]|uniref:Uncharacterized protein n=1 Tax=Parathielavia hyrcaniae TaxID=113614 RepID=A0AAN6PVQ6_9PEZI|nr:hypothetical protein N658DRAFT_212748 [Parathielavia hyrcaniae]